MRRALAGLSGLLCAGAFVAFLAGVWASPPRMSQQLAQTGVLLGMSGLVAGLVAALWEDAR